jgi:Transposase DDE domain
LCGYSYEIREEQVCLRKPDNIPAGQHRYRSPYDSDTRVGGKRDMVWAGYKVHLTETCEPDDPHLITNVTTTNAAIADITMTTTIHSGFAERGLLPDEHLVDAGYVDAEQIIQAKEDHNLELVGPVARDTTRQKAADGAYDNTHFHIDWNAKSVTCPDGKTSAYWQSARSHRGTPVTKVRFAARDCGACPVRKHCTTSRYGRPLRPPAEHEVLRSARQEQDTPQWRERYKLRSGVEGTISQGVLAFGLRRSRYRGLDKTRLQHLLTAAAMNLARADAWLTGVPLAPTRTSHFAALRPAA